jgi:hypothetical protein
VSNRPWTETEVRVLREYYAAGLPIAAVVAATGRNRLSVGTKARKLGLPWRGSTQRMLARHLTRAA